MEIPVSGIPADGTSPRFALGVVIIDATTGQPADLPGLGGPDVPPPTPVTRTAALASVTTAGSVPAGCTQASFANSGAANATVAGGTLPPGYAVTFDAPDGDTLAAIAYSAVGTTLLVSTVA
ncbi:hypothetical protein P3T23_009333 [Paraburkholderia sp. GAS448]|uniref:hypothetical protein n=1 Tax=Paraburkholderia sp. GAS448 TaxID=3035136 RepID=UPI003D1C08BB